MVIKKEALRWPRRHGKDDRTGSGLTQVVSQGAGLPVGIKVVAAHQFQPHAGEVLSAGHLPVHLVLLPGRQKNNWNYCTRMPVHMQHKRMCTIPVSPRSPFADEAPTRCLPLPQGGAVLAVLLLEHTVVAQVLLAAAT